MPAGAFRRGDYPSPQPVCRWRWCAPSSAWILPPASDPAPGDPPRLPYVLLLDNTCLLAERQPPVPEDDAPVGADPGAAPVRAAAAQCVEGSVEDRRVDAGRIKPTGDAAHAATRQAAGGRR